MIGIRILIFLFLFLFYLLLQIYRSCCFFLSLSLSDFGGGCLVVCVGGILAGWPLGSVPGAVLRAPAPELDDWPAVGGTAVLTVELVVPVAPVWRMPPGDEFAIPDPVPVPVFVAVLLAAVRGPTGCVLGTVKEAVRGWFADAPLTGFSACTRCTATC
jgi:hypothetical protein